MDTKLKHSKLRQSLQRLSWAAVMRRHIRIFPLLLAGFVLAKMFYFFPSGSTQPADLVLVGLAVLALGSVVRNVSTVRGASVVVLTVWIIAINVFWYAVEADRDFLITPFYYVFNAVVFLLFYTFFRRDRPVLTEYLRWAIAVALLIQVAALALLDPGPRATGTFNNPNQLGYWSLLVVSIYGVASYDRKLSWFDFGVLGAGIYVCYSSLSRAALLSVAMSALLFVLFHRVARPTRLIVVGAGVAVGIFFFVSGDGMRHVSELAIVQTLQARFERPLALGMSEIQNRGYDRILENIQYTFVGAGEGAYNRFYEDRDFELHSSFGTIFFAYGIVGFVLFLNVLYQSVRGSPLLVKLHLVPALLYGLTHQGLRFSWFWALLGIVAAISLLQNARASRPAARQMTEFSAR